MRFVIRKKISLLIFMFLAFIIYISLSYRNNYPVLKYLLSDWLGQSEVVNIAYGSSTIANYGFTENHCGQWIKRGLHNAKISDFLIYLALQPRNENIKNVVIYLGENDLAEKKTVSDVAIQYDLVLKYLINLYPNSLIHVLGIKMSPSREIFWPSFHILNRELRYISEREPKVIYHSLTKLNFLSEKVFLPDGVHVNQAGYKIIFTGVYSECKK